MKASHIWMGRKNRNSFLSESWWGRQGRSTQSEAIISHFNMDTSPLVTSIPSFSLPPVKGRPGDNFIGQVRSNYLASLSYGYAHFAQFNSMAALVPRSSGSGPLLISRACFRTHLLKGLPVINKEGETLYVYYLLSIINLPNHVCLLPCLATTHSISGK